MKHYVCTECKTTSTAPGVCETEDCIQEGLEMKECFCEDGLHSELVSDWKEKDEDGVVIDRSKDTLLDLDSQ
jgi:hypothetical protein